MTKDSLGNNPCKINIGNSGEGKETQNQNQRTSDSELGKSLRKEKNSITEGNLH